jgi:hypothetical protein
MKDEKQWISVFVDEFFKGLKQVLLLYQVEEKTIDEVWANVSKEVKDNENYLEKPSKDMVTGTERQI